MSPEVVTRESVLETTGKVQFNEEALGRVHAPLTGRVLEVFAAPGDTVEVGSRLFVLDSADLGAAKADYAKAVADVERSQDALRLARELLDVKAVAQKEVRETENDARKALAERERAAARLQHPRRGQRSAPRRRRLAPTSPPRWWFARRAAESSSSATSAPGRWSPTGSPTRR